MRDIVCTDGSPTVLFSRWCRGDAVGVCLHGFTADKTDQLDAGDSDD
eukprot:gene21878-26341_t